jgi:hypothetical protein
MKRDMDLVRSLLLRVEDLSWPMMNELMVDEKDAGERARVGYHLRMLVEEGFLTGDDGSGMMHEDWYNLQLAWQGHEFLDTLREKTVWEKSKKIAGEASVGSAKALFDIGKAVVGAAISSALKSHGIG